MTNANWNFAGKTALVSGGASGIGKANVRKLAAAGASVVFSDLDEANGRALESEVRAGGADVHFRLCDATKEADVQALAETAFALHGRLDIAINNVGGPQKPGGLANRMHECNLADWLGSFDKTLHSVFLGMRHQIPLMLQTGGGAIVNISSMAGVRYTESAGAAYGVAKGAVVRLTEFAAVSYAKDKIRINVVAPGVTATEAVMRVYPDEAERNAKAAKDHPMGRLMAPEEIADACLWACSDAASGVTGLMIPVAGGWAAK